MRVLGPLITTEVNTLNSCLGSFNGTREDMRFIVFNEVAEGAGKKNSNKMKSLITESEFRVNRKNIRDIPFRMSCKLRDTIK